MLTNPDIRRNVSIVNNGWLIFYTRNNWIIKFIYPHITLWKTEGKIGVFRSKIDDGTWVILQEQQPNYKVSDFHFGERIPRIPILLSFLDCI